MLTTELNLLSGIHKARVQRAGEAQATQHRGQMERSSRAIMADCPAVKLGWEHYTRTVTVLVISSAVVQNMSVSAGARVEVAGTARRRS